MCRTGFTSLMTDTDVNLQNNPMTEKKKKKNKKPNPIADYLLYLVVRVAALFIQMVHPDSSVRFARTMGTGLYLIYKRGRKRAMEHLLAAYPEKDRQWHETICRRSFEHLAMLAFDVLKTSRLINRTTWRKYIEFDNISEVLELLLHNQSVIMVTGHYGNFEILGYALAVFGLESYAVARPLDNKYVNDFLFGVREKQGQKIVDKKGAAEHMMQILESGSTLSFVADQNAGRKGLFVDFFGRKASTYKSIALLAMQFNLPIVVGYCRRLDDRYRFKLGMTRIIKPEDWADKDKPVLWITEQYTAAIEAFIREDPEQYWWVHRRWKTRPPGEVNATG